MSTSEEAAAASEELAAEGAMTEEAAAAEGAATESAAAEGAATEAAAAEGAATEEAAEDFFLADLLLTGFGLIFPFMVSSICPLFNG